MLMQAVTAEREGDRELADAIEAALGALNTAARRAAVAGLHVEFDIATMIETGAGGRRNILSASVVRPIPIGGRR
jgi:hypothetical protein